jgi:hypothetical protein
MLVSGTVDLRCESVVLTVARWRGESNMNWGDMVRSGATCAWGKRVSLVMMVTERILLAKKTQTMGV